MGTKPVEPFGNRTAQRPWTKLLVLILAGVSLLAILEFFKPPEPNLLWIWALDAGHWPLFGAFALVMLGIVRVLTDRSRVHRLTQYVLAFIITAGFCLLTEVLQYFGPRDADLGDLARGMSGAFAFLLLMLVFDSDGPGTASRGRIPIRIALIAGVIGLFWVSCGPLLSLARAYSRRAEAFPQICNFQSSWERSFYGVRDAKLTIVPPPDGWSGESEENLAGRITFLPATFPAFFVNELHPDWSEYDRLCFVIFTELTFPVELILRISDQRHNNQYDDRFNRSLIIHPGINHFCVDLADVRAGPKGRELDLSRMHNLALFAVNPEEKFVVYIDSFRLEVD